MMSYQLSFDNQKLVLRKLDDEKFIPFYIDFLSDHFLYRLKSASRRKEFLARAFGISPVEKPIIVDATAGLGRDSFVLASIGYEVTMLERSDIIFALLKNALARAKDHIQTAPITERLELIHTNSIQWLAQKKSSFKPDIIYLDPMFPERRKKAAVKKEMRILQELLGADSDGEELFKLALTCAQKRVVVKRPRLAPYINELKPSFSLTGNSNRFDIYI